MDLNFEKGILFKKLLKKRKRKYFFLSINTSFYLCYIIQSVLNQNHDEGGICNFQKNTLIDTKKVPLVF